MKMIYAFILICSMGSPSVVSANETGRTTFTFENSKVNNAIIKVYEEDPSIWTGNPLLMVAICYMSEKRYSEAELPYKRYLSKNPSGIRASEGSNRL